MASLPLPRWMRSTSLKPAVILRAFCVSFLLLGSYYLVRPFRDDIGAEFPESLDRLFAATFATMLVLSPIHGLAVSRIPRRTVLPAIFGLSAMVMVGLHFALKSGIGGARTEQATYVFLAVYNLFCVSTFWSWLNDRFPEEEARRWFGSIAVGGTLGSLLASRFVVDAPDLGPAILSVSGVLLAIAGAIAFVDPVRATSQRRRAVGGGAFAGFKKVISDRYLGGIATYVFLMTVGGTVLYMAQSSILNEVFPDDRETRRDWLGNMDFASNVGTLLLQLGIVGPWMLSKRVTPVLAALPLFAVLAFPILGFSPTLWTIVVLQVMTRIGKYGLAKPSRESMYTVVVPEDRFKAKAFLDTVVYRGGDSITSIVCQAVLNVTGSVAALAFAFTPLAVAWTMLAVWLGRTQEKRANATDVLATEEDSA